ncbi:MAG: alkaline phosphatase D family protein [Opitutaceae bacterium]
MKYQLVRPGLMFAACLCGALPSRADRDENPQHAPPEAFLPGETLPYFGSENPWNRRFFTDEEPPRVGQPQLLLLQEGKIDQAIALCRERLAADPAEVESHLILAFAFGRHGKIADADRSLRNALALGLPPERVLVGPRALTNPLEATATWRRLASESTGLLHGPMLGAVTPQSARFWVRTLEESPVEIRVSRNGNFDAPDARGTARTSLADDYTAVVEVAGLEPRTEYIYQVLIDGRPVPLEPEWRFRTFPADDSREIVRVAFGGCAKYWPPFERMWDTVRLRGADAFLLLGDNVYIDLPETAGPLHDYTYYQRHSRPEFRRLIASTPVYAIWDDHDAGIDDIFLGPYPDKPAWKPQMLHLFRRNWNNPSHGAEPGWPGVWHAFRVGAMEFFMLDGRYYRENFLLPNPSMLGPVQKRWLLDALQHSTATFKLIVSPVAFADDAKIEQDPSGVTILAKDIWSGFTAERQEIYDFIGEHRISGVVLLSGDRHRADFRVNHRARGYPFYELMCSWLTNPRPAGFSGTPIWEYNEKPTFALLTCDPAAEDPALALEVSTIEGQPVFERTLYLSELTDH